MEVNKQNIQEQLSRILKSPTFIRSKMNKKLLTFLVQESLEGNDVREYTIGAELFGESYDPVKDDNKVRVYVYNLRKKLDEYYAKNATKDDILFTIEKGQYLVVFGAVETPKQELKRKQWLPPVVAVFALAFVLFFALREEKSIPFWNDNLSDEFPTTVLMGDVYTIYGPTFTGKLGVTRDFTINSDVDYNALMRERPDLAQLQSPNRYQYSTRFAPYCSKTLSCYFTEKGLDFDLKLLSEWDDSNLHKENIVYFGQTKTMRGLKNALKQAFPYYLFGVHTFSRIDPETKDTVEYSDVISDNEITDYTIVAKTTTQAGNTMKFFHSDQDCGAIKAIEYFTNEDSVKAFYNRHNIVDEDFIAIFKVVGWQRKGYEMEFILLDKKQ